MNVTLTFNVFLGPLAIALLVGCGSMKNYDFNRLDDTIATEQSRLQNLQTTLAGIDAEQNALGDFLDYVNSASGKRFHLNAQCKMPVFPYRPPTMMPTNACETQKQKESLMGTQCAVMSDCDVVKGAVALNKLPISASYLLTTGCVVSQADRTLLTNPGPVVKSITDTFCSVGMGKLPKWLRVPSIGKLTVTGAMIAVRTLACTSTINRFKHRVDNHYNCMANTASNCSKTFKRWKLKENQRLQLIDSETRASKAELKRCKIVAMKYPGLDRLSAQQRFNTLENRAVEIIPRIYKAHQTLMGAKALKVSVDASYQGNRHNPTGDPG